MKRPRVLHHMCRGCHTRRAVSFAARGVAWRRDHPLCPACFRALRDSVRAASLVS